LTDGNNTENNSPSPGKRAEKQNVAAGLTASKGSLGSHKKKKKPPHHLFPPQVPKQNFAALLTEHGSFTAARKALRHRQDKLQHEEIRKREADFGESHLGALFDETVRLSGIAGNPSVNTVFEKMDEVLEMSKKQQFKDNNNKERDIIIATRRSWTNGELNLPQKNLDAFPPYVASTVTLQLAPPKKMSLARNNLASLFSSRTPQISCHHVNYLTELDLGNNNIVHLPHDIGFLQNLRRCNLERNRLQSLPDSLLLLKDLKVLKLSQNNFKELHVRIGELSGLEHLDLSNNVINMLPPTLPRLRQLKFLDVSSNSLAHLAIQPILQEYEDRLKQEKNLAAAKARAKNGVWDEVYDRVKKQTCYYNKLTGVASNTKPIEVELGDEMEDPFALPERLNRLISQKEAPTEYIERRKILASQGTNEWNLDMDPSSGRIFYKNNVSGEQQFTIPPSLDTIGGLVSLKHFKANQNLIRKLPDSICRMTKMEVLEAKNNYLDALPEDLGNLTKIKRMVLNQNEIATLPESMAECTSLVELQMTGNYVERFPDFISKCKALKKLMLGNNFLKILPYSLGFLTSLQELQLFNNPLIDPPYETVMEGLEQTLYFCRQKYWARVNGPPPVVEIHASGIGNECLELQPEFRDRLKQMIIKSEESKSLELQQLNITEIPPDAYKLVDMKNLDLSRNDFSRVPLVWADERYEEEDEEYLNFISLNSIYLKSCGIREIHKSIHHLHNIVELNLEDNKIEVLPKEFCRLRRLQFLNLSKNRLYDLPQEFGNMVDLREVILDINRLEFFPTSIGNLRHLETLSANRNWLYKIDPNIVELKNLIELNLDANFITTLPESIGEMNLTALRLSHNRLAFLEDNCLRPNLINSLAIFWVSSNNLIELPQSFVDMKCLDDMKIEYNPMRSPPMDLVQEGMQTVMRYCRVRASRVNELKELLVDAGFETDKSNYTPESKNVLTGETGFLTPDDLKEFDDAVNCFLNGKYYLYPAPAGEMVDKVENLRHEREFVFYHMILESLLRTMADEVKKREVNDPLNPAQFSENCLRDDIVRPWGRNREQVNCYAVPIKVLLKETEPNFYVKIFRESLYDYAKESLPDTIFEYNNEVLKDALNNFESPYGMVAGFDKVGYDVCECVDDDNNELRHFPCTIPSCVIVKTIYTAAESKRRADEETILESYFSTFEQNIYKWLEDMSGKKSIRAEIAIRIKQTKINLEMAKKRLVNLTEKNLENSKDLLKAAEQRKKDFEDGKPLPFHKLESPEEAVKVVDDAEEAVKKVESDIEEVKSEIKALKKRSGMSSTFFADEATVDLNKKMCHLLYKKVYNYGREQAKQKGWRRPWDGPDGQHFIDYQLESSNPRKLAGEGGELPGEDKREDGSDSEEEDEEEIAADFASAEAFESSINKILKMKSFDWTDTQDMSIYDNAPYTRYNNTMGTRINRYTRNLASTLTDFKNQQLAKVGLG